MSQTVTQISCFGPMIAVKRRLTIQWCTVIDMASQILQRSSLIHKPKEDGRYLVLNLMFSWHLPTLEITTHLFFFSFSLLMLLATAVPEVVHVTPDSFYQLATTRTWDYLGLSAANAKNLLNETNMGEQSIIGIVDKGLSVNLYIESSVAFGFFVLLSLCLKHFLCGCRSMSSI